MGLGQIFEPEETVGNYWHEIAGRIGAESSYADAAVSLGDIQPSLAVLFRALGGPAGVDLGEAAPVRVPHRRRFLRRFAQGPESVVRPGFDGERLRLPPVIDCFEDRALNRAAYFWLAATAALTEVNGAVLSSPDAPPAILDDGYVRLNAAAIDRVLAACPGLRGHYDSLCASVLKTRLRSGGALDRAVTSLLSGTRVEMPDCAPDSSMRIAPVPFWLDFLSPGAGRPATDELESDTAAPSGLAKVGRKLGERRDLDQADRKDGFIVHRFEAILSWAESMNINRSVDVDDDERARKAMDDQDRITLSRHHKKVASRLRLHLDLSPSEADHERLSDKFTYPEWNHRTVAYMPAHCRVLEAEAELADDVGRVLNTRRADRVRRQFETMRPRRILQLRQRDGNELDLDALIASRVDLAATGRGSDRIYLASCRIERDLSAALLLDTSRSTEADMGGICVIDVARDAVSSLAHGLDACGDRFGIWAFSSLRRDRVFLTRCKRFDEPMSPNIDRRIAGLKSGHYTRLGTAIRHAAAQLAEERSAQRLLLVLTDGKPNDLDHYEGLHGIEDSRLAVREARRAGLVVHAVIIDDDGQDWFARIFGRSGFTLLPTPERLHIALPEIYRSLTQET